jgi:hypothetical protein
MTWSSSSLLSFRAFAAPGLVFCLPAFKVNHCLALAISILVRVISMVPQLI